MIKKNNKINLYCITTEYYKNIFKKFFLPCFKNSKCKCIEIKNTQIYGGYFENQFKKAIEYKLENIIKTLYQNQIVIWSDVDIVFPLGIDAIIQDLKNRIKSFDLLISRENKGDYDINSGFFIAKSNKKTISFFKELLKLFKNSGGVSEQPIFKNLLYESNLNWDLLPISYWNLTIGYPMPKNPLMIHANHVPSFKHKLKKKKMV